MGLGSVRAGGAALTSLVAWPVKSPEAAHRASPLSDISPDMPSSQQNNLPSESSHNDHEGSAHLVSCCFVPQLFEPVGGELRLGTKLNSTRT